MADYIKFFKVLALPATPEPDALYYVRGPEFAEFYVTSATGEVVGGGNSDMIKAVIADVFANLAPQPFSHGLLSPTLVLALPEDTYLQHVAMDIQQAFNGDDPTLRLRTDSGTVLLDTTQNDPTTAGLYETAPALLLPAGTEIYLEINPGFGASAGSGYLLFNFR